MRLYSSGIAVFKCLAEGIQGDTVFSCGVVKPLQDLVLKDLVDLLIGNGQCEFITFSRCSFGGLLPVMLMNQMG